MSLDRYLEALDRTPDELLERELGVDDNWPILFSATMNDFSSHLSSGNYIRNRYSESYVYRPANVMLTFNSFEPLQKKQRKCWIRDAQARKHMRRQERDFDVRVVLKISDDKKIEEDNWRRALAMVIKDIGEYARMNDIPLCFPRSQGTDYLHDYSRIVYFPS